VTCPSSARWQLKAATELLVANIKAGAFQDGDMSNEEAEFGRYYDMVRRPCPGRCPGGRGPEAVPRGQGRDGPGGLHPHQLARPPSPVPVAPTSISSGVTTSATRATTGTTVRTRRTPTARTSRRRSASSLAPTRSGMPPPSGSIARTPRRGCSTSSGSSSARYRFTTVPPSTARGGRSRPRRGFYADLERLPDPPIVKKFEVEITFPATNPPVPFMDYSRRLSAPSGSRRPGLQPPTAP
jgi:hypothetical protein